MSTTSDNPFPKKGTKGYKLLRVLIRGDHVTPLSAVTQLNLPTLQARASELRKVGWPVRVMKEPHPYLRGEEWDVYYFDDVFKLWLLQNEGKHPNQYPSQMGRGKYGKS
jgi:hypothetical protein